MQYAIVCFLDESETNSEVVQEVPVSWLRNNRTICMWPPNSLTSHIINATEPNNKNWSQFRVRCDRICENLTEARRKCTEDQSSGDERGRGQRRKVLTKHYEEYVASCPSPPRLNMCLQPHNGAFIPPVGETRQTQGSRCENIFTQLNEIQDVLEPQTFLEDEIVNFEQISKSLEQDKPQRATEPEQQPIASSNYQSEIRVTDLDKKINKIINMLGTILVNIQELKITANKQPEPSESINKIRETLPFEYIDKLREFESLLQTDLALRKDLVIHFKAIGGMSAKDFHTRCMSHFLKNILAEKCSWKGLRNNHKIGDCLTLKCLFDAISSEFQCTQKEYEILTRDWLRHAKQRKEREEKRKE